MALEEGDISEGFKNMSQAGDGGGNDLTKGLWTPKEDALLVKYVTENGERRWNDVSRKFGLMRCGNSCRLRWFNHLRSNLKKEDFTPEEENTILKLHAKYGNRWSHLARHLPGRTDNEIKNYWNIRLKRHVRAGLPIYPPEILREIQHRRFNTQKLELPPQNQIQFSSLSSLSLPQNPDFRSFPSSSSSSFEENPNFNCIPSSHQTNTASISTIQENPDSSSINSMSLIELAMSYPLLIATLYPPINMYQLNLHSHNNGGVVFSPPPSQHLKRSNSPYTPVFAGSQLAPSDIDTVQMDDPFMSENFEIIEIPSIQSCFEAITPTFSSTNGSDHFIVTSNGEDNYNMDPDLCSGRNSGLLQDVLRQPAALLSSQLPCKQSENDKPAEGRLIMHDDSVAEMNHPNITDANLESGFGSSADDMNLVDDISSLFSSNDIGVLSEVDVFEILNEMNDMVDFPLSGPPQALNLRSNGASTEPANVSDGNMDPATEIQGELVCCPVPTTQTEIGDGWATDVFSFIENNPADTDQEYAQELMGSQMAITLIEQERDWALGYMPSFS
ncbi:transcription factor MYB101 [Lactuca sativa]|uniref:transcription factor MYB101 n=1 Tax=Lactuca sativa TaxID=4236 RepID=UPI000CD973BB|nr:transcription factor MYB101 [Lactuca sativa]